MHHYQHHIGDYEAATSHLTWTEDMAYTRMLRVYYRDEKPLPRDVSRVCHLLRCSRREQSQAVARVLDEFFVLCDDGWRNKRADEEIQRFREKSDKARKAANAKHSHSERMQNAVPTVNRQPITVNHPPLSPKTDATMTTTLENFSPDEKALFDRLRRLGVIAAVQCVQESQLIRPIPDSVSAIEHYESEMVLADGTAAYETPGRVLFWRMTDDETSGLTPQQGWPPPDNDEFLRRKRFIAEQVRQDADRQARREDDSRFAAPSPLEISHGQAVDALTWDKAIGVLPDGMARNLALKKQREKTAEPPGRHPMIRTALLLAISQPEAGASP